MLKLFVVFCFLLVFGFPSLVTAKTLVLVPGYFSSAVPGGPGAGWNRPYFSQDIVQIYQRAGYRVYVVNNLNPLGTIEQNGELLIQYLKVVQSQLSAGESLQILAHSAGGLYSLYASDHANFPIARLITVDTPFDGVEFIGNLTSAVPGIGKMANDLNLQSLTQLKPSTVTQFIASITHKPQFPIVAYKGYQSKGFDIFSASNLSPVFYFTEALMSNPSDGIVTNSSALSRAGFNGYSRTQDYIHLDHWKQTVDADYFVFAAMTDLNYIRQEQNRFYTSILFEFQIDN